MTVTINGTTGVAGVDGTASSPAIQGNDTNTGIFFPAADTIAFAEGGAEVARFDSSGNFGIGTSSPSEKLSVSGSIASTGVFIPLNSTTAIGYIGNSNTISGGSSTNIGLRAENAMLFSTGGSSERMRIASDGAVLMGKTATDDSTAGFAYRASNYISVVRSGGAPCYFNRLTSTGSIVELAYNSSTKGTISTDGTNVAYNTSSDYRLKENIVDLPNSLTTISQLKPRQFDWKETSKTTTGFIAHELAEVMPQAVTGEKDAVNEDGNPIYQGIDTSFLVATLTAAIQEQQAIITEQSLALQDLKSRIEALEQA